jgi:hypothetical protein
VANAAAMTFGCLCDRAGSKSSMIGSDLSNSIHNSIASNAFALAVARVDGRPFSIIGETVTPRVLEGISVRDISPEIVDMTNLGKYYTLYMLVRLHILRKHSMLRDPPVVQQRLHLQPHPSTVIYLVRRVGIRGLIPLGISRIALSHPHNLLF